MVDSDFHLHQKRHEYSSEVPNARTTAFRSFCTKLLIEYNYDLSNFVLQEYPDSGPTFSELCLSTSISVNSEKGCEIDLIYEEIDQSVCELYKASSP